MIGKRLRDVREFYNLKQVEMAEILGVSRSHYSNWEIDKESIPLRRLNILCNHFDVSMDYMVGFSKEKNGNGVHELHRKIVGSKIKEVRKKNNINQTELANVLNTDQQTISNYEIGKYLIIIDFAIGICEAYNVSLDWLCGRV